MAAKLTNALQFVTFRLTLHAALRYALKIWKKIHVSALVKSLLTDPFLKHLLPMRMFSSVTRLVCVKFKTKKSQVWLCKSVMILYVQLSGLQVALYNSNVRICD